jgi:DNA-binding IclR family transcriptional regulator
MTGGPRAGDSYTTLRRGLSLLDVLGSQAVIVQGGLTVSELSQQLDVDKSQVSRTLGVLVEQQYVLRDPVSRKYRIGWRLLLTAQRATASLMVEEVQQVLEGLASRFRQRGYMVALEDRNALMLLDIKPYPSLHESLVGRSMPLYYTASGRALVMHDSLDKLTRRLSDAPFERPTERAPANAADLHSRLTLARTKGYVVVDEEMETGLVSVAVPLPVSHNGSRASISLVGNAEKFRPQLDEAGSALLAATLELQRRISGDVPPQPVPDQ